MAGCNLAQGAASAAAVTPEEGSARSSEVVHPVAGAAAGELTLMFSARPCHRCAGFVNEQKQFPRQQLAFVVDGLGTVCGSLMGTSPIATYIESAAGIRDGGRSGITAITCSFYFFVSLFFVPVLSAPVAPSLASDSPPCA